MARPARVTSCRQAAWGPLIKGASSRYMPGLAGFSLAWSRRSARNPASRGDRHRAVRSAALRTVIWDSLRIPHPGLALRQGLKLASDASAFDH